MMDKIEYFRNKYGISNNLFTLDVVIVFLIVTMSFVIFTSTHLPVPQEDRTLDFTLKSAVFNDLTFDAKAVYVYDLKNKTVIFEKNSTSQLPLASLTKLMMALTASDILSDGSKIAIKQEFLAEEGDSGLIVDESWNLKDLIDFSLISSSNDGARSIASVIGANDLKTGDFNLGRKDFIKNMNVKALAIGLKQTYFINESGLDEGSVSGGYSSAKDVGRLLEYMLLHNPELLEATKYTARTLDSDIKEHVAKNTNSDVGTIPGLLASKTGYTELAGGNLVIAFDPTIGRPIVAVVLGSTIDGRFSDMAKIVEASEKYLKE